MPSAAACYLVSHQQTRQLTNTLNFISAQLIITFPQECFGAWWHGTKERLPHRCQHVIPYEYFDVLSALHMATFHETSVEEYRGKVWGEKFMHGTWKRKKWLPLKFRRLFSLNACAHVKLGLVNCRNGQEKDRFLNLSNRKMYNPFRNTWISSPCSSHCLAGRCASWLKYSVKCQNSTIIQTQAELRHKNC